MLLYPSHRPLVSFSSQAGTKDSCTGLLCCYLITPGSTREVADIWGKHMAILLSFGTLLNQLQLMGETAL